MKKLHLEKLIVFIAGVLRKLIKTLEREA